MSAASSSLRDFPSGSTRNNCLTFYVQGGPSEVRIDSSGALHTSSQSTHGPQALLPHHAHQDSAFHYHRKINPSSSLKQPPWGTARQLSFRASSRVESPSSSSTLPSAYSCGAQSQALNGYLRNTPPYIPPADRQSHDTTYVTSFGPSSVPPAGPPPPLRATRRDVAVVRTAYGRVETSTGAAGLSVDHIKLLPNDLTEDGKVLRDYQRRHHQTTSNVHRGGFELVSQHVLRERHGPALPRRHGKGIEIAQLIQEIQREKIKDPAEFQYKLNGAPRYCSTYTLMHNVNLECPRDVRPAAASTSVQPPHVDKDSKEMPNFHSTHNFRRDEELRTVNAARAAERRHRVQMAREDEPATRTFVHFPTTNGYTKNTNASLESSTWELRDQNRAPHQSLKSALEGLEDDARFHSLTHAQYGYPHELFQHQPFLTDTDATQSDS